MVHGWMGSWGFDWVSTPRFRVPLDLGEVGWRWMYWGVYFCWGAEMLRMDAWMDGGKEWREEWALRWRLSSTTIPGYGYAYAHAVSTQMRRSSWDVFHEEVQGRKEIGAF